MTDELKPLIFHIDVNSAFLSWSAVWRIANGVEGEDLRKIPSVVGGDAATRHGIVLAKSTPAKKYGIETAEPIAQALRKCPNLVVVSSDFEVYEKYSAAFMRILMKYSDKVEKFSIDEAFVDMTESMGMFESPLDAAERIKNHIYMELGFTVNIGISTNKLLAKMASDFQKPDKVHTLFPEEIPTKMWPLPVENLLFVGKSSAARLRSLGIRTIGELARADENMLRAHFKKQGDMFHRYANGEDSSFLQTERTDNKGYGHSTTLPVDVADAEEAKRILLGLSERIGKRLRLDGAFVEVVAVTIRYYDLTNCSHQLMLEAPTNINNEIHSAACRLFDELWDGKTPIRLLGVRTTKVTRGESGRQLSLFDDTDYEKMAKLEKTLDTIRQKFGEGAVSRASALGRDLTKKENDSKIKGSADSPEL